MWHNYIKAVNYLSYHCRRLLNTVDGWRLTDNGWTPAPTTNRGSERSRFVWHIKTVNCLSYHCRRRSLVLSDVLYLYIASLGDCTAETDVWLKITVQWCWFHTHCSETEHISKWSVLVLSSGGWSLKQQQHLFLVSRIYVVNALYNHLPHQVPYSRTSYAIS